MKYVLMTSGDYSDYRVDCLLAIPNRLSIRNQFKEFAKLFDYPLEPTTDYFEKMDIWEHRYRLREMSLKKMTDEGLVDTPETETMFHADNVVKAFVMWLVKEHKVQVINFDEFSPDV